MIRTLMCSQGVMPSALRSFNGVLGGLAVCALASACLELPLSTIVVQPDSNLVVQADSLSRAVITNENALVGDANWNHVLSPATREELAAFLSQRSALPGDTVGLFAMSQDSSLTVSLYRVGWYGGLGARLILTLGTVVAPATSRCSPPVPGPAECLWPLSARIWIPSNAVPGVYVVRYVNSRGAGRFIPLVIKPHDQTSIVVMLSFNTYQAYNSWGGGSLYALPDGTAQSARVSFLRPYTDETLSVRFVLTDLPLVRFLERRGYPVSYVADRDLDTDKNTGFAGRLMIISGHSEYWSARMRAHVEALRAAGVGLAFFGANDSYYQVRYEDPPERFHGDLLVCYKSIADPLLGEPLLATMRFRDPAVERPENALIGIMHNLHPNGRHFVRLRVKDTTSIFFQGTGFQPGDTTSAIGGWEGDRTANNGRTPPHLHVLFETPYVADKAGVTDMMQATFYEDGSGSGVFAAGTVVWNWALDDLRPGVTDPRVQRLVDNLLAWYLR